MSDPDLPTLTNVLITDILRRLFIDILSELNMPNLFERFHKSDPQEQFERELNIAERKHSKHFESEQTLFIELSDMIEMHLPDLSRLSNDLRRGTGDIELAISYSDLIRTLEKTLKKSKLLRAEDVNLIMQKLQSIRTRLNDLEHDYAIGETNNLRQGMSMSRYSFGEMSVNVSPNRDVAGKYRQRKMDAGKYLSELEKVMTDILRLVSERLS